VLGLHLFAIKRYSARSLNTILLVYSSINIYKFSMIVAGLYYGL